MLQDAQPPPATPPDTRKKRRAPWYFIGLLVLLLVNAALIALALNWLYGELVRFEASTPTAALERYFGAVRAGEPGEVLADSGFVPDARNTEADYGAWLLQKWGELPPELEYRQVAARTGDGGQLYAVFDGAGQKLGEVALYEGQGAGGGWRVSTPAEYLPGWTITAPAHAAVLMNGEPMRPEELAGEAADSMFGELPEGLPAPAMRTYQTGPTLFEPVFSATAPGGAECLATPGERSVTFSVPLGAEAEQEYAARAEAVAKVYSNFISEDVPFTSLAAHLVPGTDFYERMRTYYVGWYIDHDGFAFQDMRVYNVISSSESCFTAEVEFTYEVYRGGRVDAFPSHYRMAFAQIDGTWQLLELQVL